jgi:hypothetical protein
MADKKSGVADKKSEREARLAKALRENLKRRKVAARSKDDAVIPAKAGTSGREDSGNSSP